MDWRLKAFAFHALGLPGGETAHYFVQRYVTRSWPRQPQTLVSLKSFAKSVVEDYARHVGGTPRSALEIGAGRDLAVPLALRRLGVGDVIASDIKRLARLDLIRHAGKVIDAGRVAPRNWSDLDAAGIHYRAPHRISVKGEKVDCSCSNDVLEHVPPEQLVDLLAALRAVTTGITTHSIDYSDHYARSDGGASCFNFFKYDDRRWRRFNGKMHYVNRLRHSDYLRLFREAGFSIVYETSTLAEPPADLAGNIAPQFRHYAPADLYAMRGRIVAA